MNDIAKCNNKNCKVKNKCLRYTIKAEDYQWYGQFDENDCEHFLMSKPDENKQ